MGSWLSLDCCRVGDWRDGATAVSGPRPLALFVSFSCLLAGGLAMQTPSFATGRRILSWSMNASFFSIFLSRSCSYSLRSWLLVSPCDGSRETLEPAFIAFRLSLVFGAFCPARPVPFPVAVGKPRDLRRTKWYCLQCVRTWLQLLDSHHNSW